MRLKFLRFLPLLALFFTSPQAQAEFLFAPVNPTPNGLYRPTINYNLLYEYSAWDIFYAPHTGGNYPDVFAPYGGRQVGANLWAPETRTSANSNPLVQKPTGGFGANDSIYNPDNPVAFWDTRNASIKQTSTSAFIVGPDISGNIYTFSEKTHYVLSNNPDYDNLGSVILQFSTAGTNVDFSTIKLVYFDGFTNQEISALDAEYLREYQASATGPDAHWSASAGYLNRVALQWDMSGLLDAFGNPITAYEIRFSSITSSMSLQRLDLVTTEQYQAGIPLAAVWGGGNGTWGTNSNWTLHTNSGLTAPQQNGNIRFGNNSAAIVSLDQNFSLGELIFETAHNVTITPTSEQKLTSNTGIATRAAATGTYTVNADFQFGALNFFEINAGTVNMNGILSGSYGMVKLGDGTLVLNNNNTFNGFLGVQAGTLRINGNNTYTGSTNIVNGKIIVGANAGNTGSLGTSTSNINVGGDSSLYQYTSGGNPLLAELIIDGNHTISRGIQLAPGDFYKRLGTTSSASGSTFSGSIFFNSASSNPDSTETASGGVYLTATAASDRLTFSGAMSGGATTKTVTIDGQGIVTYSGANKTYNNATIINSGTLAIAAGTSHTGNGAYTINSGGKLQLDGVLSYTGATAPATATVNVLGRLTGAGSINRNTTIGTGGTISPGALPTSASIFTIGAAGAPKTLTFANGGRYEWTLNHLTGTAGQNWDKIDIIGTLQAPTSGLFTIDINANPLTGWNPLLNWEWLIASTTQGITGFNPANFNFDSSDFQNVLAAMGNFNLQARGNDLYLVYAAVPEPSRALLLGVSLLCLIRRRNRPLTR